MTAMMPWLGLGLLILAGLGVVFTGIPAAVVLLATACFGVAIGGISGDAPVQLLGVLPERLINLLENDLLQAIPLYVLYELSVFVAIFAYRKRQKRRYRIDAEEIVPETPAKSSAAAERNLPSSPPS